MKGAACRTDFRASRWSLAGAGASAGPPPCARRSGCDIWLTYRSNHEQARETARQIQALDRKCELLCFDVSDFAATEAALRSHSDETAPSIVVFNAGITRDNLLVWMKPEEWSAVVRTDLDGFYNVMNSVLFSMIRAQRGGSWPSPAFPGRSARLDRSITPPQRLD